MNGVGARLLDRANDALHVQVGILGGWRSDKHGFAGIGHVRSLGIGLRMDGDGRDPKALAGANHTARNLTAIADENLLEGHGALDSTDQGALPRRCRAPPRSYGTIINRSLMCPSGFAARAAWMAAS